MRKYTLNTHTNLTKGTFEPTVLPVHYGECGEVGPTFAASLAEARISMCLCPYTCGRVCVTRKELRVRKCEDGAFTSGAAISTNTHQT